MHALKSFGRWISVTFMSLSLVAFLTLMPFWVHLTNRQAIKGWLESPQLDEIIVDALGDSLAGGKSSGAVDTGALTRAAKTVITPDYIGAKLSPAVDGVYDWLERKTDKPEFEILLSDKFTAVAEAISKPLASELNKLPACPADYRAPAGEFNLLQASCIPPGADVNALVEDFKTQFMHSAAEGGDIKITGDSLGLTPGAYREVPTLYGYFKILPFLMLGLALGFAGLAIALDDSKYRGVKRVAQSFIAAGLMSAAGFWLVGRADYALRKAHFGGFYGASFAEALAAFMKLVLGDIGRTGIIAGLAAAAFGAALWGGAHTYRKPKTAPPRAAKAG